MNIIRRIPNILSTQILSAIPKSQLNTSAKHLSKFNLKGVHEPEYLDLLKPQIPFYPLLNIQIKGYDYAVLESYGSYLHRLSNKLGLTVSEYWCAPSQTTKIETLQHESNVIESTYELDLYERNVQIKHISGRLTALLVDIVTRSLPAGVQLSIHEHDHYRHHTTRYIPDLRLQECIDELASLRSQKSDDVEENPKKKK